MRLTSEPEGGPPAMTIANRVCAVPPGPVTIRRRPRTRRGRPSAWYAIATALVSAGLLAGCGGGAHTSSPSKVMSGAFA
jgi:hypothetical protein